MEGTACPKVWRCTKPGTYSGNRLVKLEPGAQGRNGGHEAGKVASPGPTFDGIPGKA